MWHSPHNSTRSHAYYSFEFRTESAEYFQLHSRALPTFSLSQHAQVRGIVLTSVRDVAADQFINAYAQHLKRSGTYERWHVASKDHVDVSVVLYQRMETNR